MFYFLTYMQGSCAELIVVDDGQQAVDAYRASKPDLMLLDVHMPNVSGLSPSVVPVMLVNSIHPRTVCSLLQIS